MHTNPAHQWQIIWYTSMMQVCKALLRGWYVLQLISTPAEGPARSRDQKGSWLQAWAGPAGRWLLHILPGCTKKWSWFLLTLYPLLLVERPGSNSFLRETERLVTSVAISPNAQPYGLSWSKVLYPLLQICWCAGGSKRQTRVWG